MKKVYLVGIGGISMSGIALYLHESGYEVIGSDLQHNQQTTLLESKGIKIIYQQVAKNINSDISFLIYTSAANNPEAPGYAEIQAAHENKIKTFKRAEYLGHILNEKFLVTISGMHGKTTTCGMLAKILTDNKFDPTVFIGTNYHEFNDSPVRMGQTKYAVVEACEYDRSFLEFTPDIAIITNIEEEHLDYFKGGVEEIKKAFLDFINRVKVGGIVIAYANDANIDEILRKYSRKDVKIVRYAHNINCDAIQGTNLLLPGAHNIDNACAAYNAALKMQISSPKIIESLKHFSGTSRRSELIFQNNDIRVYDDYAHHPTEIKATLRGFRTKYPKNRIICIFQPHQYSRTKLLFNDLVESFQDCDQLILLPVYEVIGREENKGVGSFQLFEKIREIKPNTLYFEKHDDAIRWVTNNQNNGDIVLTMGAGNVNLVSYQLRKLLDERS